jgi:hypothetical protein
VLLVTFVVTYGFTLSSNWNDFSIVLCGIYLTLIRDLLGICVVPFITAHAITTVQKGAGIEIETKAIFFTLVTIFILSILVYCALKVQITDLLHQLSETDQSILKKTEENLLRMSESYIKETLTYIALLLGISQSSKG